MYFLSLGVKGIRAQLANLCVRPTHWGNLGIIETFPVKFSHSTKALYLDEVGQVEWRFDNTTLSLVE